jgi:hypothetical protein
MTDISPSSVSLEFAVFMVNDKPYCLWSDKNIKEYSLQFLNKIDPGYFIYQADTNLKKLNYKKYKQHAALAIRTAYSHGLETLFSLICASIQAPYCIPGWLLLCSNTQLKKIVSKINSHEQVNTLFKNQPLNWENISRTVHAQLVLEDKEKEDAIKNNFGDLWGRFAAEFLSDAFSKEYNSIKHGFRVKPGGFSFALGTEEFHGAHASQENMQLIGKSEFGSSFEDCINIGENKRHIQLRLNSMNWDPEDMVWGLYLVSMSISNIVSFLKVINGVDATKVKYSWPSDTDTFLEPWQRKKLLGVTSLTGLATKIPVELITNYSENELLDFYRDGKVLNQKIFPINTN